MRPRAGVRQDSAAEDDEVNIVSRSAFGFGDPSNSPLRGTEPKYQILGVFDTCGYPRYPTHGRITNVFLTVSS